MARLYYSLLLALALALALNFLSAAPPSSSLRSAENIAQDLLGTTQHSEGAVINLSEERLTEILRTKNRGFRMAMYMYSEAHEEGGDKKATSIRKVREEFEVVAKR